MTSIDYSHVNLLLDFFEKRIETVTLDSGDKIYVQRHRKVETMKGKQGSYEVEVEGKEDKPKGKKNKQSKPADDAVAEQDLPDDIDADNIAEAHVALKWHKYRVATKQILINVKYNPVNTHVKLDVAFVIPILGKLKIGTDKGNLKHGVHNKFQVKTFASGEVALTLVDDSAVLSWDLISLGQSCKDSTTLFSY